MRHIQMKDHSQEIAHTICDLSMVLGRFENQLQAIREMLTLRPDFNPQRLFSYLSFGEEELTRTHLMWFMEDNERPIGEEEIRLLFSIYGYKEKLSYSDFLNYIFPFDTETIKTISTVNCKKYMKADEEPVSEELRCILLLLIQKEIEFLHYFEEAKLESLPHATRQGLKKAIKQLKKFLPLNFQQGVQSDYVLTFKEFKGIMKKLKNLPERKAQPLCRRLSMQKDSFIGIDQLEIWFKPWNRLKQDEPPSAFPAQTLFDDIEESIGV